MPIYSKKTRDVHPQPFLTNSMLRILRLFEKYEGVLPATIPKADPASRVTGKMKLRYWCGCRYCEKGVGGASGDVASSWRVASEMMGDSMGESGARSRLEDGDGSSEFELLVLWCIDDDIA